MVFCPKCEKTNSEEASYCNFCGNPLPKTINANNASTTKTCPVCKKTIASAQNFCPYCASDLRVQRTPSQQINSKQEVPSTPQPSSQPNIPSTPPITKTCPVCKKTIASAQNFCPYCPSDLRVQRTPSQQINSKQEVPSTPQPNPKPNTPSTPHITKPYSFSRKNRNIAIAAGVILIVIIASVAGIYLGQNSSPFD